MRISILLFLAIGFVSCGTATQENMAGESEESNFDIKLKDLSGNNIELAKGKKRFINLWASWCGPCIKEMPSLEKLEEALKNENIAFYFASNEPLSKIKKFKENKDFNLEYTQLENSLESLNIIGLPTTFILDENGEILFKETGMRNWNSAESVAEIKQLINQ